MQLLQGTGHIITGPTLQNVFIESPMKHSLVIQITIRITQLPSLKETLLLRST